MKRVRRLHAGRLLLPGHEASAVRVRWRRWTVGCRCGWRREGLTFVRVVAEWADHLERVA